MPTTMSIHEHNCLHVSTQHTVVVRHGDKGCCLVCEFGRDLEGMRYFAQRFSGSVNGVCRGFRNSIPFYPVAHDIRFEHTASHDENNLQHDDLSGGRTAFFSRGPEGPP